MGIGWCCPSPLKGPPVTSPHVSISRSAVFIATLLLAAVAQAQDRPAGNPLNEPQGDPGVIPIGADGKPLNLDFETGTLEDWTAEGEAFKGQPIKGEIDQNRVFGEGKKAEHTGQFWIGGFEKLRDKPTGTLTSAPFKVTHPCASFLIGGGSIQGDARRARHGRRQPGLLHRQRPGPGKPAAGGRRSGEACKGKEIFIRIVDQHTGGWGHVNFDDFRFHKARPRFKSQVASRTCPRRK